jgi:hypothetical protein
MNTISIHCFPHELEQYDRILSQLNLCFEYIKNKDNFKILSCLNLNQTILDIDNEEQEKYIYIYKNISKQSKLQIETIIQNDNNFLGVNEHRRHTIKESHENDTIIFLDCDLHFNKKILGHLENSIDKIKNILDWYIISPSLVKMWDSTWDCLVNENYLDEPLGLCNSIKNHDDITNKDYGKVYLSPMRTFKWGGGWFNAISASLLKQIGIPNTFKGYGPDDTFVMECCKLLKKEKHKIQQFKINNLIVCENRNLMYTEKLFRKNITNFRSESEKNFHSELNKFYIKIKT